MDYEVKADPLEAVFEGSVAETPVIRPVLSGAAISDPARAAFVNGYLRRGSEVELKSFSGVVAADGGFAVPKEIDEVIDATLKGISPIRAIANVVRVGSAGYRKLVTQNGVTSGWASETATRPETATPTFNEIVPSFGELYANPAATQAMLDDAAFDVEAWLASEISTEFAKAEGAAFVNGNGTNKPRGFLQAATAVTSDATRPFGTLQYVASGAAGAFVASNPQDKLVELVHALRAPYRQGASWVMNASTLSTIRKFKTIDGAFIWQPGISAGQPDTLLGYPGANSSYGTQIPAIFGAMRVAGTVIWATDLVERRSKSGGGKGRPSTINYSYSVSMAVALSSRPVARIGRIWADGNLLRGSAGDLKVDTQLRLYTGHDDQPLDPLMASAEAAGQCPAHRGLAYAIFEDLQLADYGNRIPSLTFELFEREDTVPIAAIFDAATGGAVTGTTGQDVRGFALSGQSATEPLSLLLDILPVELSVNDDGLTIADAILPPAIAPSVVAVVAENREQFNSPLQTLDAASQLPHSLALRYYDADRDFQAGVQRSERGPFSRNAVQIELPAVLGPAQAKQLVDHRHLSLQSKRTRWRGDVAYNATRLRPGDCFADVSGRKWQVEQIEHRLGSARILAGAALGNVALPGTVVVPGRNVPAPDLTIGETRIAVVDLPIFGMDDPGKPLVAIFAAGTGEGWRRAALSLRVGSALDDIGTTAMPAIIGTSVDALSPHNVHLVDERDGFRVQFLNSAMELPDRVGSPLDFDAPYAWLGGELIRYGNCEALGNRVYRLSRLRRNCFRSGHSVPDHPAGHRFILIQAEAARLIEERNFMRGDLVEVEALGLGDSVAASASALVDALAVTPPAPVHGKATTAADGSVTLRWVRRSRVDSGWRDGIDQAMVEAQEQYFIRLTVDDVFVGEWTTTEPYLLFGTAEWAALAIAENSVVTFAVRQVGRYAQSDPLLVDLM